MDPRLTCTHLPQTRGIHNTTKKKLSISKQKIKRPDKAIRLFLSIYLYARYGVAIKYYLVAFPFIKKETHKKVLKPCNTTTKKQHGAIFGGTQVGASSRELNDCWKTFPLMSFVEATELWQEGPDKQSRLLTHLRGKEQPISFVCPRCFKLMITPLM